MKSTTELAPQFRVGDWVMFPFGLRRVIVEIIEDRGPIGYRGRRLYGVRLNRSRTNPRTTEVPEEDLELPPKEILTPDAALERGISTEDWPRLEFDFRYIRNGKTNTWMAMPEFCRVLEGEDGSGVAGYATEWWKPRAAGKENAASVIIDQEYDPRLRDPRDQPGLWWAMREEARKFADKLFTAEYPKAVIKRD
jgi:hypothetical protein